VALPAGYFVVFGGFFDNQQRAGRELRVLRGIIILLIFVILLAKIDDHIREGLPRGEAVVAGSLKKLRAILMTNLVMIVGSIPLAFHVSTWSELHRPLAVVYVGGFFGVILLRMIAVPVFYGAVAGAGRQAVT
jgi:cobalt-zinc-cadmium resistance protein CzcA